MYTNDKCDNWNVRVVGSDAKLVEYCEIDDKHYVKEMIVTIVEFLLKRNKQN